MEKIKSHLLRTISIGTPGFTIAIIIHSLPRSTDMTAIVPAMDTHNQVLHKVSKAEKKQYSCYWTVVWAFFFLK